MVRYILSLRSIYYCSILSISLKNREIKRAFHLSLQAISLLCFTIIFPIINPFCVILAINFEVKRLALDVTITFNLYRNWLWSSDFHKQYYLHKPFTTHFVFYLFQTLHQVTYPSYLHLFHLFFSFNNQMTKLKYCYSHLKSFVFMFWIVLFMFLIIWTSHTLQSHFSIHFPSFLP